MKKITFVFLTLLSISGFAQNTGSLPYWAQILPKSSISGNDSCAVFDHATLKWRKVNCAKIGDSLFVHRTGNESIAGVKIFSDTIKSTRISSINNSLNYIALSDSIIRVSGNHLLQLYATNTGYLDILSDNYITIRSVTGLTYQEAAPNGGIKYAADYSGAYTNRSLPDWGNVKRYADSVAATVSTVSVATANGFSGTVANPTTTPAITIVAGAITPTSVNGVVVSGSSTPTLAVTGTATVSGANTGDETTSRINALYGYTPGNAATVATNTSNIATNTTNITARMMALIPTAVKTTTYAASANDFVPCDNTSGSFTVTLPNAPADKTVLGIKMIIQGGTNTITVNCAGSDVINKAGGVTTFSIPYLGQAYILQYKSSSAIWYVIADDLPKSALDAIYQPLTTNLNHWASIDTSAKANTTALSLKQNSLVTFNTQTTSYTLVLADYTNYSQVRMNSASATNLTVPPNSSVAFPIGAQILLKRIGAGITTIVQGAGVTVTASSGVLTDAGQYGLMTLIKTGTNTWDLENGSGGLYTAYTPTFTGHSVNPTIVVARYILIGKMCTVEMITSGGTSNAFTFTITLPFPSAYGLKSVSGAGVNNGANLATPCLLFCRAGSNIMDLGVDPTALSTWANANAKSASFILTYEIQ